MAENAGLQEHWQFYDAQLLGAAVNANSIFARRTDITIYHKKPYSIATLLYYEGHPLYMYEKCHIGDKC